MNSEYVSRDSNPEHPEYEERVGFLPRFSSPQNYPPRLHSELQIYGL
jgi:hypothetical protein